MFQYKNKEWTKQTYLSKRDVCVVAGKGTGKTYTCARWVIDMAIRYPNSRGLITMNTNQQVRDIFNQDLKPLFNAFDYEMNKVEGEIRFSNGTMIHLRSAEPEAAKKVESVTYDWWWGDECSFYQPDVLKLFYSRTRTGIKRKRITSMPSDPDAFIYRFAEKAGMLLFELGTNDNPDAEFAKAYEKQLRLIYEGEQLKRYLYGARVSFDGAGAFYLKDEHKSNATYNKDEPLILSWDFNVSYRAVTAWQVIGKDASALPIVACVHSYQMTEATVHQDAQVLHELYKDHNAEIIIVGDASGANRTALTTESMWGAVKQNFPNAYFKVPKANPLVKDTIQCANWALTNSLVTFNRDKAKDCYNSMMAAKLDKYGDIDKKDDYKAGAIGSHDADTARYALWYFFGKLFPGNRKKVFIA